MPRVERSRSGGKKHGRHAALGRRDFHHPGGSERLCKVESGVALRLPPHSIKVARKKVECTGDAAGRLFRIARLAGGKSGLAAHDC